MTGGAGRDALWAVRGTLGGGSYLALAALIAVRSLCRPQIDRVYDGSDERVAADNPDASADLLDELRAKARRRIDRDLAVLVSTQTGLAE